nr:MAG: hypothetical protein [Bacteriophage sp.]
MSLTLGRQGGIAQPLKKHTVGQTNIAHVYDGANHIWPTSVIHFSDFTSVQLRYIWSINDGRDLDTKSYYVNSPINGLNYVAVGWSWTLSQIPYLYWGGDNTDSGAECVMFNIESMIDLEDKMPDIMKMNLCANWFGSLSRGHVTVECTAYKGGVIVHAWQLRNNVLGATAGSGSGAPTAFQAWEKSCEDTLALQGGLYQWALTQQNQRFEDRERLNSELFGVYIDGRNRTDALIEKNNTDHFNLYKYTRDADDDIRKELSDLKAELAVTKAIRPYQDKLIQCEMEKMFTAGINYTDRKTCNVIYGVVTLPNEPTVTGLVGRNACGCLPCGFTQPASGTPAQ